MCSKQPSQFPCLIPGPRQLPVRVLTLSHSPRSHWTESLNWASVKCEGHAEFHMELCVCRKIWSDAASDHTHTCRIKVCFLSRACQHFETCTAFSKGYLSLNYVVKRGDGNCLNRKHCFQTPLLGMRLEQVGPWQQEHAAFPTSYQIRKQGVWTRSRSRSSSHPQVPFPGPTLKWQSQKFHNFPNSAIS